MAYTYQLSYQTRQRTITPLEIGKIVLEKEMSEAFFREKYNGSMVLVGEDYLFLLDAERFSIQCCQQLALSIFKDCSGSKSLFWSGTFTLQDIKFDLDNRTATVKKISVSDQYNQIFSNWHKNINLLDLIHKPGIPLYLKASYLQTTPTTTEYNPLGRYEHERAIPFVGALQWLVSQTMIGTSQESMADGDFGGDFQSFSQFLYAPVNPVTKEENYLRNVLLEHISEAKRPKASTAAREGYVSLKDVLAELKDMFKAYWYIDEAGKFHIEHISFFPHYSYLPQPTTLDLTGPDFKEAMSGLNQYEYQQEKLSAIEGIEFTINRASYSQQSTVFPDKSINPSVVDFNAAYMIYSETCAPKDDKNELVTDMRSVDMFTTDYIGVTFKPDTMPDIGWYLVHVPFYNNMDGVISGWSPISGLKYKNGCLSPARLYYDFGRYENSFPFGLFSSIKDKPNEIPSFPGQVTERPLTSRTVKAIKAFSTIQLNLCCGNSSYDFSGFIKHPLADKCLLQRLEYDLVLENVEVNITGINTCTDSPFPDYEETEEPVEGCLPKGQLIRTETMTFNTNFGWTIVTLTSYFSDGNCGEYSSTKTDSYITNQ